MPHVAAETDRVNPVDQSMLRDRQSVRDVVEQQLLSLAQSGRQDVKTRLPGERELAAMLGVSRTTLRQALNSLEEANLVTRRRGRSGGTFLVPPPAEGDLRQYSGLSSWLRAQGLESGTRLLSTRIEVAGPRAAAALHLDEADYVFSIDRVRVVDGTPISLEYARIPVDRFPDLLQQPIGDSIGEIMFSRYGRRPSRALEWHQAVLATPDQAELIGIAQASPVLKIDRITLDQDDRPIEFGQDIFRGDWARVIARVPITEDLGSFPLPDSMTRSVHLHSM